MTKPRLLLAALFLWPHWAAAADFDGARLSALWGLPFAGVLLSIALVPLAAPWFWHRHYGKVTAAWALAFLLPFAAVFGLPTAGSAVVHTLVGEYLHVSEAGGVVDRHVEEVVADTLALAETVAGDSVTDAGKAGELLDVEMQELAWPLALVAAHRRGLVQAL